MAHGSKYLERLQGRQLALPLLCAAQAVAQVIRPPAHLHHYRAGVIEVQAQLPQSPSRHIIVHVAALRQRPHLTARKPQILILSEFQCHCRNLSHPSQQLLCKLGHMLLFVRTCCRNGRDRTLPRHAADCNPGEGS